MNFNIYLCKYLFNIMLKIGYAKCVQLSCIKCEKYVGRCMVILYTFTKYILSGSGGFL